MRKLTEARIRNWRPEPVRREVPDGLVGGLYLVVQPSGSKSWAVRYRRRQGGWAKLTLGQYPAIPLADARQRAKAALLRISGGEDPAAAKAAGRPSHGAPDTIAAVAEVFVERYCKPNNRRWHETDRLLRKHVLPEWRARRIGEIRRHEVHSLLDAIVDAGTPVVAIRVLAAIRKMFNWAIERGYVESSPAHGVKAPTAEASRDRVLTDDEVAAVWRASAQSGWPFGLAVQLLMLTGQRKNEVAGARWSEIDLKNRLWSIPQERRKGGLAHVVPLSGPALRILEGLPRIDGSDYVFPAQRGGTGHVQGFSLAKNRLDALSGVTEWRLHDLRRTLATGLQRLHVKLEVIEEVLGHVSGSRSGVVAVYQRHKFEKEKRQALEAWGRHLQALLDDAGSAEKVVVLGRRRITNFANS